MLWISSAKLTLFDSSMPSPTFFILVLIWWASEADCTSYLSPLVYSKSSTSFYSADNFLDCLERAEALRAPASDLESLKDGSCLWMCKSSTWSWRTDLGPLKTGIVDFAVYAGFISSESS